MRSSFVSFYQSTRFKFVLFFVQKVFSFMPHGVILYTGVFLFILNLRRRGFFMDFNTILETIKEFFNANVLPTIQPVIDTIMGLIGGIIGG